MDEYLFLVVAKLKADRQKLEREQREQLRVSATLAPEPVRPSAVRRPGQSFSKFEWREQS